MGDRGSEDSVDEDIRLLLPKRPSPLKVVLPIVGLVALIAVVAAVYRNMPERGASMGGEGYIIVRKDGSTWVMLNAGGTALPATPDSAAHVHAQTGPCTHIEGGLKDPSATQFEIDQLTCDPGKPLVPTIITRLRWMGATFGYWADGLKPNGDDLEPYLRETPEVVAAIIDPRAGNPQMIPLYPPLNPESVAAARQAGAPPVIISIKRNDLLIMRYRMGALVDFLARDRFIFAGAAGTGGWLVRELVVASDGTPSLERLLVAPEEAPWPDRLRERTVRVARREPPLGSSAAVEKGTAAAHGSP
jgi:hypothetical protein